ncbi:calcium-binding and coiled-coil domain-containing protein 2 isoform X2 [Lampris incognitus]|uniref:calcium-binding and coiled-coil domain-containing protein 2 isoform X2 n=1 Tax=Lampris incognitus TaxID=2546036 RepID=UPI0024B4BD94|nr:calcium-binding and coiled-coil domain-containing protein 2 isoform X2 [Lampris incognitus]
MMMFSMESSSETGDVGPTAAFSQVVFSDIPHTYSPLGPVTCCYTLTEAFQPSTRDWVGIFKVGWSTTRDYHTFVWVEQSSNVAVQGRVKKQAVFQEYYLPKDDAEFYQFCYIDNQGQVRGASTPFCFKTTAEQSLDCSLENDLLVITTQEQVDQSVKEKAELTKELARMREEAETIKGALKEKQQEVNHLKEQNEQKEQENGELNKQLIQMKEQNDSLASTLKKLQQETDHCKEEVLIQMVNRLDLQQREILSQNLPDDLLRQESMTRIQERYDQAVVRVNQLMGEKEELRGAINVQSVEISELKSKVREREQELCRLRDNILLIQVDLQSSERDNKRLSAELHRLDSLTSSMEELKRENQELHRNLSQQVHGIPDDVLKAQLQTVLSQLQDAREQLAEERQASRETKRQAEEAARELREVRENLEKIASCSSQTQLKSGKLELQLTEAHGIIAEKEETIAEMERNIRDKENMLMIEKQENQEKARENKNLRKDIEELRREFADLQAIPPADSPTMQPSVPGGSPAGTPSTMMQDQQKNTSSGSFLYEDVYETIGSNTKEEALMCRHCQEKFPGITQDELQQHEESHKVCPFCTLICDNMEQSVFEDHVYSHEL